jgi:DHA1 family bicyclomycin/chloramphenicol resistance-like MFS transporter/DHA1 family 2-module integral membrane pump EmrD-like MFS transporter
MIASVILAPFLGGYFEHYFGWRSNFFFLFVWLMLVMLVICFVYKETGQHHGKHRLNLSFMLSAYKALLTSRSFIGFALCAFLTYGGFFAWVTAGPIVLIHGAKISPVLFGWLAIINGLIIITAGNLNGKLVKRMTSRKMMQIGWLIMVVGGLLELVGYYLYGTTLYSVLIPVVIAMFGSMLIFPNSFANAFANVEHIGGYAGALYSGIQLLGGVVFSGIISHLDNSTQLPIAWVIMVSGILSFIMYKLVASKA